MKIFNPNWLLIIILIIVGTTACAHTAQGDCLDPERNWVEKNRNNLPTDLAALGLLAPQHQRAVAIFAPPELRAQLWRLHLESFLTTDELNDDQRTELSRILAKLDPAFFTAEHLEASRTALGSAEALTTLFGQELGRRIFGTLGTAGIATAAFEDKDEDEEEEDPSCECAFGIGSDFCPQEPKKLFCKELADDCDTSLLGCGVLLLEECDGMCKPLIEE